MRRAADTGRARAGLVLLVLAGLLTSGSPSLDAGEEQDGDVYVRDVKGVDVAVALLAEDAKRRGATEVVVAFDQVTFAPPPGWSEYGSYDFAGDLAKWLPALDAWASAAPFPIRVTATLHPERIRVGEPAWRAKLRAQLEYAWWKAPPPERFRPALHWVRRCLPEKGGLLVLVASELTPEQWVDPTSLGVDGEKWRSRLLPLGEYWDAEAVGTAVAHAGCSLYVIAPEAQFGDETPTPVLPALPWASRPFRLFPGSAEPPATPEASEPPYAPRELTPEEEQVERALLHEVLRPSIPDDAEREAFIDELLRTGRATHPMLKRRTPTTPGDTPPPETEDHALHGGGRFGSKTPLWFPHHRGTVLFNDHTPSAFGYWPYARAARKSGGRYLFYPFPPSRWLDVCPRDAHQLARMTPELSRRNAFAKAREGDRALSALCRAAALVVEDTPWRDAWTERRAAGWAAYESVNPLRRTDHFQCRRKPFDLHLQGSGRQLRRAGEDLVEVVALYDRALRILDRALARCRRGAQATPHPRSIADLRLGRYWFSMSAFHLSALALYLSELERFAPPGWDEKHDDLVVTYVPAIKMSDCLDGYEGRTLAPEAEARYPRGLHRAHPRFGAGPWKDGTVVPGQQGNILRIPVESPDYRAKRPLSHVLRHLDRRLMARALDMVKAAREVMDHHAKTPWGWTTYYSEAYTFVFLPVTPPPGHDFRTGEVEDDDDEPPWSPTPGGRGGSSPGGPTTGR